MDTNRYQRELSICQRHNRRMTAARMKANAGAPLTDEDRKRLSNEFYWRELTDSPGVFITVAAPDAADHENDVRLEAYAREVEAAKRKQIHPGLESEDAPGL